MIYTLKGCFAPAIRIFQAIILNASSINLPLEAGNILLTPWKNVRVVGQSMVPEETSEFGLWMMNLLNNSSEEI